MWKSKGRSGLGDTNIQGMYEDWDGLSPNGRQYKNSITQETRNLSGADYWHARKADYPKQEPETWIDGKANIKAFAQDDKPTRPQKKKVPIASKILSQNVTLNRLDTQEKELNEAYENSELDIEEYEQLLYCLQSKRDRAHKSLCKALGKSADDEPVGYTGVSPEHVSEGLESYRKQGFSSMSGGDSSGCVKNLKKDLFYFLTGSIVGLTILLTITNT